MVRHRSGRRHAAGASKRAPNAELGFAEEPPTTETSRRGHTLPTAAVAALERHRERRAFERKRAGDAWGDRGLVFCNVVGGYVEAVNLKRRTYWPMPDRAGLPRSTRLHDLLHTVASLMINLDESLKAIQELLGHADISTTANIYGCLSAKKKRDAAMRLDSLLAANG